MRRLAAVSLLCLGLAACGTTQATLPYTPEATPVVQPHARPVVALGAVTDLREGGREDPRWIGTIRGGFGNPIKRLDAPGPVTEVVRQAFADALAARGLLAPGADAARYLLAVEILDLRANQLNRREGVAEFRVALSRANGGVPVLTDRERATRMSGTVITLTAGVFGSMEELQKVAQQAMSAAIDQILDKPGFAAALR